MAILLFFIDGFGVGGSNPLANPLMRRDYPIINDLFKAKHFTSLDASLGIPGLPQSATGQTVILTGVNAVKLVGRHIHGFPTPTLIKLLLKNSILLKLKDAGFSVTNANMYTRSYPYPDSKSSFRGSATTIATIAAGLKFRTVIDGKKGKGVFQDITNRSLIDYGYNLDLISPEDAGKNLANIAKEYDFTLFEYFKTDLAGHKGFKGPYKEVLWELDRFFYGLLNNITDDVTLLVTSDHGNIEDLTVNTHTKNQVPAIAIGNKARSLLNNMVSIQDISPSIYRTLTGKEVSLDANP